MRKIIIGILLLMSLFSCSDWLDVKSSTQQTEKEMFNSHEGFRTALNGVYNNISKPQLYGREMSWGFASLLGNNYETAKMHVKYKDAARNAYQYDEVKEVISGIWLAAYNAIANLNNILNNIEDKEADFFPENQIEKDVITGESLALRAMLHFDLLRLFAPAPIVADEKGYIPYVKEYPSSYNPRLTVAEMMENILADLESARELLEFHDTDYNYGNIETATGRFEGKNMYQNGGLFFSKRGFRLNYIAVNALLARVYLYNQDYEKALESAERVQDYKSIFRFTPSILIATDEGSRYRKMLDDILFSGYNVKIPDYVKSDRYADNFEVKNLVNLFSYDFADYRFQYLMSENKVPLYWQLPEIGGHYLSVLESSMAPIIRRSEVVYILCECLIDKDKPRAIELLRDVMVSRGIKNEISPEINREDFLNLLYMEETREFLAYGQTFFLYKRLNRPLYDGVSSKDMTGKYVIPVPDTEMEY